MKNRNMFKGTIWCRKKYIMIASKPLKMELFNQNKHSHKINQIKLNELTYFTFDNTLFNFILQKNQQPSF